jgi:hypothetical protein
VLDPIQDFLFRESINTSTDAPTFLAHHSTLALIFQSNYSYLAAALVLMLTARLAALW